MLAGLTSCTKVKVTPSSILIISVQNPTGEIPKLVHITSAEDSHARQNAGFVIEAWYTPEFGNMFSSGTDSANQQYFKPVQQTPSAVSTFYMSTSAFESYKGNGSTIHKWDTSTEYTVEIYT